MVIEAPTHNSWFGWANTEAMNNAATDAEELG